MSQQTTPEKLIRNVQTRLYVDRLARRTFKATIVVTTLYAVALLAGRLTGYLPDAFQLWHVALLPAAGLLIAAIIPGRPSSQDAARRIDTTGRTKDLFLTATLLESAAGEYKPLVMRDAERAAPNVVPDRVVPFEWERQSAITSGLLGLALAATFFVPVLDPFGKVAEAQQDEVRKQELEKTRKVIEARKAKLAEKDLEAENSAEVEKAIEKMAVGFKQMKKGEKKENQQKLNLHQAEISKMYQKLNAGDLKEMMNENKVDQQLGALHDEDLFRKMLREMQQGSSDKLDEELDSIKQDLERLTKTEDPIEREELKRKMQKQLKELSDFASDKAGSKQLHAALEKAMDQLESGSNEMLSKEEMQALQESLELAEMEIGELTQAARDMKSLEEALKMISMAKQMNAQDQLDGEMMGDEMSLEEYEELYAQLMGQGMGEGEGEGDGDDGQGMGGDPEQEDESTKTDFKDEESKSAIQKGKILLSMKTKGLSDTGEVKDEEYKRVVGEIQQSLDDVIEQEQIPPGYIENIKKYFDTISDVPMPEAGGDAPIEPTAP